MQHIARMKFGWMPARPLPLAIAAWLADGKLVGEPNVGKVPPDVGCGGRGTDSKRARVSRSDKAAEFAEKHASGPLFNFI